MNDFNLHIPTRILFGKGVIADLREQIPCDARTLITYGGDSMKKTSVLDQVLDALKGMDMLESGGVGSNPAYGTLMDAAKLVRKRKMTFLLAVGGDSVLDGTKFTVAAVNYLENIDPWHILQTGGKEIKSTILIGCMLTLPAAGSESSAGAVVPRRTIGDRQALHSTHAQPVFAVFNLVYTYTLLSRQAVSGIVGVFVHIVRQYVTKPVNAKIQDRFIEDTLLTLIEDGSKALKEPENYDMCANVIWAATQMLNDLIGVGVPQDWVAHMLDYEPIAMHGLGHMQTLVIALSALWNEKHDTKRARLLQYAERV